MALFLQNYSALKLQYSLEQGNSLLIFLILSSNNTEDAQLMLVKLSLKGFQCFATLTIRMKVRVNRTCVPGLRIWEKV
jgi:hypothetical protein